MTNFHIEDAWKAYKIFESLDARLEHEFPIPEHRVEIGRYRNRIALAVYKANNKKTRGGKWVFEKYILVFEKAETK